MIKVLIVDDSPTARDFLAHLLSGAGVQVIGTVADGETAVTFVERTRPDVITMDIHMPGMNGIDATRRIMETNPVPIVIVSGNWDPREVEMTFRAMEAGALAIVRRPPGTGHPDHETAVAELVQKVRLMSEVKVVRRWFHVRPKPAPAVGQLRVRLPEAAAVIQAVAIGASTGGPLALQTILSRLPKDFPAPVLIVQHMAKGFLPGMIGWLRERSGPQVGIAEDGEHVLPGRAYFAPDGLHMGVDREGTIRLAGGPREHGACPSVSYLFRSVANAYGRNAAGILLTGMGSDGAQELKLLREKGAVTIAQDRDSSVVYGMPAAAVELGAAAFELSPEQIPSALAGMMNEPGIGDKKNA